MWGVWHRGQRKNADWSAARPDDQKPCLIPFQICAPRWGGVSHGGAYADPEKQATANRNLGAVSCAEMQNNAGTEAICWHKSGTDRSADVLVAELSDELKKSGRGFCEDLSRALSNRIGHLDRALLTWAVMRTLKPSDAAQVFQVAYSLAGPPTTPFGEIMDDARFWAGIASRPELKAYLLAAYEELPADDRAAFWEYVKPRERAA